MTKAELKKIISKPEGWPWPDWSIPDTINGIPVEELLRGK